MCEDHGEFQAKNIFVIYELSIVLDTLDRTK